jgi:hypothetical protein
VRSKRPCKDNIKFICLFIHLFIVFLITLPAAQTTTASMRGLLRNYDFKIIWKAAIMT